MYAPVVGDTLRDRGSDVTAVADSSGLRAMTDEELFVYAAAQGRRIVTENINDFRRLLLRAGESGMSTAGLLFTSSRTFPRTRRNPGPLIDALDAWLAAPGAADRPPEEDWLGLG
jgi:hypothetical protein